MVFPDRWETLVTLGPGTVYDLSYRGHLGGKEPTPLMTYETFYGVCQIRQARKDGVKDIQGWLGDEYYNDVDTLRDLAGDRIHDAVYTLGVDYDSPEGKEVHTIICNELHRIGHTALEEACDKLRRE